MAVRKVRGEPALSGENEECEDAPHGDLERELLFEELSKL